MLGSQGLIGSRLASLLRTDNAVFTTYHKRKNDETSVKLDILSEDSIEQAFNLAKPDVVINLCAIYNNLQFCEENKELVMAINGSSLKAISLNANRHGAYLVNFSTDYVFDGKRGNYKEDDPISPINFYGVSKAEGEKNVKELSNDYCIIRTSMVYGRNAAKKTLPEWILDGINSPQKLEVIYDQFMTPTYLENLCDMIVEVMERQYNGTIHLAGKDRVSRYDFAIKLLTMLQLPTANIVKVKSSDMPGNENRPADSSLNTAMASSLLRHKPERLEQSLERYVKGLGRTGRDTTAKF